ncbi:Endoglucanase E-4-like 7, partial [Homarus americanus]
IVAHDDMTTYRSWSGYGDELCWGALWLYRATGNEAYLTKARAAWDEFDLGTDAIQFSWDDKRAGCYGMVFLDMWGANRHCANVAYIALWAAQYGDQSKSDKYREWAQGQINILLGDSGHSFVDGTYSDDRNDYVHNEVACDYNAAFTGAIAALVELN